MNSGTKRVWRSPSLESECPLFDKRSGAHCQEKAYIGKQDIRFDSKVILVMPRFRAYFASGTPRTNPEHGTVLQAIRAAKRLWDEYLTWRFRYRPRACDDLSVVLDRSELGVFDRSYHATPSALALLSLEDKMHLKYARREG